MAIIQISKIQQRTGNLVDLPQLDDGEFGWATDAKRLFIGKTTPNENIEVLTTYSNISFSQLNGAVGNLNMSSVTNGQILTYVASTNTWENYTGSTQLNGGKLQLGDVANISMTGAAGIGYVLSTDGVGNLSWTPKGTLQTNIQALSNANPIIMTVPNSVPFTNGAQVTITSVEGANANTIVNGQSFYITLAADYNTSGNVKLYTDTGRTVGANGFYLTATANTGVATSVISGGGSGTGAGGANTSVQFNDQNISNGVTGFTFDKSTTTLSVTGPINGTTLNATTSVTSPVLISNIAVGTAPLTVTSTTRVANLNVATSGVANTVNDAAQSNITSVGTLTSLNSSGNITAPIIIANSNGTGNNFKVGDDAWIGDINITNTMVVKGQQDGANGYIIFGNGDTTSTLGRAGTGPLTYNGAFSAVGNANVGNLGTGGLITATGNITGGNLVTGGVLSATGNANVGNLGTGTAIITTGNITTINSGLLQNGNSNVTITANGNVVINAVGGARITATSSGANVAGTLSVSGNANVGNLGTGGLITATGNVTAGNLVTGGALSVTGNANIGNIGTGIVTASGNITAPYFIGNVQGNISGNLTVNGSNTQVLFNDSGLANATAGLTFNKSTNALFIGNTLSVVGNANVGNIGATSIVGTIATASQTSITAVGTLASLSVSGNANVGNIGAASFVGNLSGTSVSVSGNVNAGNIVLANAAIISANNMQLTTGANTNAGNITGNWTLTAGSRLQATYADLAEYYESDQPYEPGTVLQFGGSKEVTLAEDGTTRVAGVVSTDPAYVMNSGCEGDAVALALQGRVPTKVRGTIRKGDLMISGGNGFARPAVSPTVGTVIGKALQDFDGIEGIIEVAVGRL
jgi:hypothetical protein